MKKKYIILTLIVLILLLIVSSNIYKKRSSEEKVEYNYDYNKIKEEVLNKIKIMSADEELVNLYDKDINTDNIDSELMLKGILFSLDSDGESTDKEIDDICDKNNICINNEYINQNSVDKYIKDIYGNIKYDKTIKNSYYYDIDSNRYYEYCTNRIDSNIFIDTYISDVNLDKNKVTVDIFLAFGKEEEILKDNEYVTNITIYKDKDLKDKYLEYTYSSKRPKIFELDDNNYKDFSKYIYTFIDDGEGFKFKSLKKD